MINKSLLSTKLILDNGNLINTIAFNKTYFLRETVEGYLVIHLSKNV